MSSAVAAGQEEPVRATSFPGRAVSWQQAALPAGAAVLSSSFLRLDPEPRNVQQARRFVADQAPPLDPDTSDILLLLTSELVTNGVVHARTELEVTIAVTAEHVVVAVHDLDLGRHEVRTHERDGGRGLGLVKQLACDTGRVNGEGGGKTVWFRLRRPATPEERTA